MGVTKQDRAYAWGTQTNYLTMKTLAANALQRLILMDSNFVEIEPEVANDEDYSHGENEMTEQWIEKLKAQAVSHQMCGWLEEIARVAKVVAGGYAVGTPSGGTNSKDHTISPLDVKMSRQLQALSYWEKIGVNNNLFRGVVGQSFGLSGDNTGVLKLDFTLQPSGKVVYPSGVNESTHVREPNALAVAPTGLHKLFNTQVGLVVTDGVTPVTYGCKYRTFNLRYENTWLLEAGYKPGCSNFQTDGDKASGAVLSELLVDKQNVSFDFEVDMEVDSGELDAVIKQKPMGITQTLTDDSIIEGAISRKIVNTLPKVYYTARKLGEGNGIWRFQISAKAAKDKVSGKKFEMKATNDVASYATW